MTLQILSRLPARTLGVPLSRFQQTGEFDAELPNLAADGGGVAGEDGLTQVRGLLRRGRFREQVARMLPPNKLS